MADRSKIEWTDATWTPIKGCSRASEGCRNCYAEIMAARFSKPGQWGHGLATIVDTPAGKDHRWTGAVVFDDDELLKPLSWRRGRKIFVCSTSDLFHPAVSDTMLDRVFAIIAQCPQHIFQVLTKRPERMREYLVSRRHAELLWALSDGGLLASARVAPPLPNVWLGTSIEDQKTADARLPELLGAPAARRFVSAEPLLGSIDMRWALGTPIEIAAGFLPRGHFSPGLESLRAVDQVIVGGEAGPGARAMHPEWVRSLRDQCAAAGAAFFFKQWGNWAPLKVASLSDRPAGMIAWDDGTVGIDLPGRAGMRGTPMFCGAKSITGRELDGETFDQMPGEDK